MWVSKPNGQVYFPKSQEERATDHVEIQEMRSQRDWDSFIVYRREAKEERPGWRRGPPGLMEQSDISPGSVIAEQGELLLCPAEAGNV